MSFKKRGLRYVIELNKGGNADSSDHATFDNGSEGIDIRNIRSVASIQSVVGGDTAFGGSALLQLWGMKPSDMAQLSTLGFNQGRYNKNKITVYPEYTQMGLDVTMEFNPEVQPGRQLKIKQARGDKPLPVPGVPGTFWINVVAHELSSEMPDGPWFTHASVSETQIIGRN